MKRRKILEISTLFLFLVVFIMGPLAHAEEYKVSLAEFRKAKAFFDDPRPLYETLSFEKIIPPAIYAKMKSDIETMKRSWAEVVGFKSPDIVGKIAPEIKPGKYTYKDKETYPGFKQLMIPLQYERFNPGKPPLVGNFPEIEVIPTRQYYWPVPVSEATKKDKGKTKLDDMGYIIPGSYEAGYPFPQPSGKFKAQQILYDFEKRYMNWDHLFTILDIKAFNKNLREDTSQGLEWWWLRLKGRLCWEPYGWYDSRAQKYGETKTHLLVWHEPRDLYGVATNFLFNQDPDKPDLTCVYIPALRRVRKLTNTDTQDAIGGLDVIYEDNDGFHQKISPKLYPYKFELIEEREYLVPAAEIDGKLWINSKGIEYRDIKFERRPIYVLKLTQQDKNYVYGTRILYIDKETFQTHFVENYDQKGKLYRTTLDIWAFRPEIGSFWEYIFDCRDYLDLHSTISRAYCIPATWVERKHCDIGQLLKGPK